jgi:hypothetical protein
LVGSRRGRSARPFQNAADAAVSRVLTKILPESGAACPVTLPPYHPPLHFDSHQTVIDDLEARIVTIRDSL